MVVVGVTSHGKKPISRKKYPPRPKTAFPYRKVDINECFDYWITYFTPVHSYMEWIKQMTRWKDDLCYLD
jgi:hypothetical protein